MASKKKKVPKGFGRFEDLERELFTKDELAAMKRENEDEILVEMSLAQLRKAAGFTQLELAKAADMAQPEISALEKREDHRISTLRRIVHALGGKLEIIAHVKGRKVRLMES